MKMKKWMIIAAALILAGGIIFTGVMTMLDWDFSKLSTVKFETNRYNINENFQNVLVETDVADVTLVPSETAQCTVVCYERENAKHTVSVKDGTLEIKLVDARKWYEHIGITFSSPKITVYLPRDTYGTLSVKTSTGDIRVEKTTAALDLSVSTGSITVTDVSCTGDITANESTGKIHIANTTCQNLMSSGSTGDIMLKNVIAAEKMTVSCSTGDVELEKCDAAELFIKTKTGNIEGTLLTEKVFITETSTGDVRVPKTTSGGKCELVTSTGDIEMAIATK